MSRRGNLYVRRAYEPARAADAQAGGKLRAAGHKVVETRDREERRRREDSARVARLGDGRFVADGGDGFDVRF